MASRPPRDSDKPRTVAGRPPRRDAGLRRWWRALERRLTPRPARRATRPARTAVSTSSGIQVANHSANANDEERGRNLGRAPSSALREETLDLAPKDRIRDA